MNRIARNWFLALSLSVAASALHAQVRNFPPQTKLGTLEIAVFPQARLDGKPVVMAPGARILNESNMIAMPQSLSGKLAVRYRLDLLGQVSEAWILTATELEQAKEEARRAAASR